MSLWSPTPGRALPLSHSDALAKSPSAFLPLAPRERPAELSEDERWFREEVKPHELPLRSWLARNFSFLHNDVDDVVQEAYLRLMRARARGPISCPRTYLFGIARNIALDLHRRGQLFSNRPVNELPESRTIAPAADVVQRVSDLQDLALIAEAVKSMPEKRRDVFLLRAREGLTTAEIAARLGIAEPTVRVQLARALKFCAHCLDDRRETP